MIKMTTVNKLHFKIRHRVKRLYVSRLQDRDMQRGLIAYWSRSAETWRNIGDAINPYILQRLTNRNVYHYDDCTRSQRAMTPIISGAGSILERLPSVPLHVWGSGAKKDGDYSHLKRAVIYSVRGPRTQYVLRKSGIKVPDSFGDPVLIIPDLIPIAWKSRPVMNSSREIGVVVVGVILHYADLRDVKFFSAGTGDFRFSIINVNWPLERIVKVMCACDYIVSSSLHGLILADAFRISRLWISSASPLAGGEFKFHDYHESLGFNSIIPQNLERLADYPFFMEHSILPDVSCLQADIKATFGEISRSTEIS